MVAENIHQSIKDFKIRIEYSLRNATDSLETTNEATDRIYLRGKINSLKFVIATMKDLNI